MYPFDASPQSFGITCKSTDTGKFVSSDNDSNKICTALVPYNWTPNPPDGADEDFCGTVGNFTEHKGMGYGWQMFGNGLFAIKCNDDDKKQFKANNVCLKELDEAPVCIEEKEVNATGTFIKKTCTTTHCVEKEVVTGSATYSEYTCTETKNESQNIILNRKKRDTSSETTDTSFAEKSVIDYAFDPLLKLDMQGQLREMQDDSKNNFQQMDLKASYRSVH